MSEPLDFPAPEVSEEVKTLLNQKADQSFLDVNFKSKLTSDWHRYWSGAGVNSSFAQWVKVAEWTHTETYNTFSARFNIQTRYSNGAIKVLTTWGNGIFNSGTSSFSKEGNFSVDNFEAKLNYIDTTFNSLPARTIELWVRHQGWDGTGYVAIENMGGHNINRVINITDQLVDQYIVSDSIVTNEPVTNNIFSIDSFRSGLNYSLEYAETTLVMQNGFYTNPTNPLRVMRSADGTVKVIGRIDTVDELSNPTTDAAWTTFAFLPANFRPSYASRFTCAYGSGAIGMQVASSGSLQFAGTLISATFIDIAFKL